MKYRLCQNLSDADNDSLLLAFIEWKSSREAITVYWGIEGTNEYRQITIASSNKAHYYKVRSSLLQAARSRASKIINIINEVLDVVFDNEADSKEIQKVGDPFTVYQNLYRHFWNNNPNNKVVYVPYESIDMLKEWFYQLIYDKEQEAKGRAIKYDEDDKQIFTVYFVEKHIALVNDVIKGYADQTNEAGFVEKPIDHLRTYVVWLQNMLNVSPKVENTSIDSIGISHQPNETQNEKFIVWIEDNGIWELPTLKKLTEAGRNKLKEKLIKISNPERIAILYVSGFLSHYLENYTQSTEELYSDYYKATNPTHKLRGAVTKDKTRTIKGNMLVLSPASKEDKKRYTSHNYIESAKDFVASLK